LLDPVGISADFEQVANNSTDALPVHYVFPRMSLNVGAAAEALIKASSEEMSSKGEGEDRIEGKKGVIVVWDVAFDWLAGACTCSQS